MFTYSFKRSGTRSLAYQKDIFFLTLMVSHRQVRNWREGMLPGGTGLRETEVYLVREDEFGIGSN